MQYIYIYTHWGLPKPCISGWIIASFYEGNLVKLHAQLLQSLGRAQYISKYTYTYVYVYMSYYICMSYAMYIYISYVNEFSKLQLATRYWQPFSGSFLWKESSEKRSSQIFRCHDTIFTTNSSFFPFIWGSFNQNHGLTNHITAASVPGQLCVQATAFYLRWAVDSQNSGIWEMWPVESWF